VTDYKSTYSRSIDKLALPRPNQLVTYMDSLNITRAARVAATTSPKWFSENTIELSQPGTASAFSTKMTVAKFRHRRIRLLSTLIGEIFRSATVK